jgi:hypothetical protein
MLHRLGLVSDIGGVGGRFIEEVVFLLLLRLLLRRLSAVVVDYAKDRFDVHFSFGMNII